MDFLIFAAIREEEQKSSDVTKEIKKLVKENLAINANGIAEIMLIFCRSDRGLLHHF